MQHNVLSVHYILKASRSSMQQMQHNLYHDMRSILNYTSNSQITCTATNATCIEPDACIHIFSVIIINLLDKDACRHMLQQMQQNVQHMM